MPPRPQTSRKSHLFIGEVGSDVVEFRHGHVGGGVLSWIPGTTLMHGIKREPILIRTQLEGPIIGLNVGLMAIGEPVTTAAKNISLSLLMVFRGSLTIFDDLHNKDGDLYQRHDVNEPRDFSSYRSKPLLLLCRRAIESTAMWSGLRFRGRWICCILCDVCVR